MTIILILEKRTYLLRLLQAFKQSSELTIVEVKKKIPSTTFYHNLLAKFVSINKVLKSKGYDYFVRPAFFNQGDKVLNGLEKNPNISFQVQDNLIILTLNEK